MIIYTVIESALGLRLTMRLDENIQPGDEFVLDKGYAILKCHKNFNPAGKRFKVKSKHKITLGTLSPTLRVEIVR